MIMRTTDRRSLRPDWQPWVGRTNHEGIGGIKCHMPETT